MLIVYVPPPSSTGVNHGKIHSYTVSLQAGYRLIVDHVTLMWQVNQVTITQSLSERIEECVIRYPV